MNPRYRLRFFLVLLAFVLAGCDASENETPPRQSPVELSRSSITVVSGNLPALTFNYDSDVVVTMVNTGSPEEEATVRVDVPDGAGSLTVSGRTYDLLQFHWHTPSEHEPLGATFPLEMHLVHRARSGGSLLVVGVLIEEGSRNAALDPIFLHLPEHESVERAVFGFDLNTLLPVGRTSFRYDGSLTTAPYTEGVAWIVFRDPIELSAAQIAAFDALFPEGNRREVQEPHGREVLTDAPLPPAGS